MQNVLVVSSSRTPLMPCHPARARELLKQRKAAVLRRYPFTLILKNREHGKLQPLRLKLDPGSKTTGVAVTSNAGKVIFAAEIKHRGQAVRDALTRRSAIRRGRRYRNTRYRAPGILNRKRAAGWLPPSLESRISNITTWVERLRKLAPIETLSMELVKFDLQKIENPEITGIEYQQGTLQGYEVREYLLEKWNRTCAYCGIKDVPLQIEHIIARTNGGTNRLSNFTMACRLCNEKKGVQDVKVYLKNKPEILKQILTQAKTPLKDAAAVNSTRWAILGCLKATGLPVENGSGGKTKFNRTSQGYPKAHWIDAACVGDSGSKVKLNAEMKPLSIKAVGYGNRQMCGTNKFGFPIRHRSTQKIHFGFQTGDLVQASVPTGKKKGIHTGRVLCRTTGCFDIQVVNHGRVSGVSYRHCTQIQRKDGYAYA